MPPVQLTSTANPKVKQLVRLLTRPADRRAERLFVVESPRDFQRAIAAGFKLLEVYLQRGAAGADEAQAAAESAGAALFEITLEVNRKIAVRENPTGLVAVFAAPESAGRLESIIGGAARGPVLVLSGLEKPGNVGAILRTADAAGAAGVVIDQPDADVFNPNAIRASTGAVFSVPIACAAPEAIVAACRAAGVKLLAATPEAAVSVYDAQLDGPIALVLGAEAEGLSDAWKQAADQNIAVPMRGRTVDSLNVSVTAAVMLYECLRQRR
jgi:TrmH family RNA methyltransferase